MAGLNKVMLIGHLGRDPEVRYTQAGLAIANISLATTEKFKGEDRTEWHRLVVFDKLAEICSQYLKKGSQVYFEGRIQTKEYEKDGIKRWSTEIVVNQMVMLGGKGESNATTGRTTSSAQGQRRQDTGPEPGGAPESIASMGDVEDDDIPF
ncbi:MAG: single-stranded DNA-binding protein [Pseudodesulfovibrio sp.]|nr:single-stranded DNA-binding protein [Pseudodesulfovibrio sp.]